MRNLLLPKIRLTLLALPWLCLLPPGRANDEVEFNRDIRPILSAKCVLCHGPDADVREAGLRFDDRSAATAELPSGMTAIVPGDAAASELIARVTSDDEFLRMPPADHSAPLTDAEIDVLRRWIDQGAPFARHWAYQPPRRPDLPDIPDEHSDWPRNGIDHFTLARMHAEGLQPSAEADRYALIRRVALDLTGLPPTVEQADAFAASQDSQAYEHLVDSLLASPAFGEHQARRWLDLARYADSAGYADDPPRTIWAWRDWVIRAFNDGMPFDQFTIEQIAGDLLPDPTPEQLIATAFHRNTMTNNEGGTQDEEFRNVAVVDRVNTTLAVWMGTTMACAQCHTHKYDPITQEEYFRVFAIFNNTADADRRNESPTLPIFTAARKQRRSRLQDRIAELQQQLDTPTPALTTEQQAWEARLGAGPDWRAVHPTGASRASGKPLRVAEDGSLQATAAAETDTYVLEVPIGSSTEPAANPDSDPDARLSAAAGAAGNAIAGIRIQTLPDAGLPGGGAGHGGGNFVVTGVGAQFVPRGDAPPSARYVRITNHGQAQILSLAEVQVFHQGRNMAPDGTATQHSTAFSGPAERAIDGNTNGDYQQQSVTHTETVDDPWWELDLGTEQPVEGLTVWNRTDNGLHVRLADFSVALLDADRRPVWSQRIAEAPNPAAELAPSNIRNIRFAAAFADYHQPQFSPTDVLTGGTGSEDGWAVGGQISASHELVLVPELAIAVGEPGVLRLTIAQQSPHAHHVLGRFRIDVTDDDSAVQRSRLPARLRQVLDQPADSRSESDAAELAAWFRRHQAPGLAAAREELQAAQDQLAKLTPDTSVPIMQERTEDRRETRLQHRGNYLDVGPVVTPGVPEVFHSLPAEEPVDRLALAKWLVDDRNPLTARVLANRCWETLFGRGIVVTSEEFGSQGELPSHPELLDWLATEVRRNGWDTKALLKTIVMSATYRQSARVDADALRRDPDNRWLARGPRVRHSAEMIRDQALFVSGLLSDRMYGPPVKPPQPNLGLSAAFGSSTDWTPSEGADRYRRGIYTTWRRSNPYPSMATFDAPNREVCTIRRNRTNTPLQSLVTLNDPVFVEAAQALARRALRHDGPPPEQLRRAFRLCLIRPPTDAELATLTALREDARSDFADAQESARAMAEDPLGPLPDGTNVTDAAAMTVVANVLLNLDEMFLKR